MAITTGTLDFPDSFMAKHFGHHERFLPRHPGHAWRFNRMRLRLTELHCLYDDPGVSRECAVGLMGSVGMPARGYCERPIILMVSALDEALRAGTADISNRALMKVLAFRDGGLPLIETREEPLAFTKISGRWFVREGTHRTVALGLIGADEVEGIDFESARLV